VPVKVVSERLRHAGATIMLTVYQHVHPAWAARRPTASRRCSRADPRREVSRGYHEGLGGPYSETPRAPDLEEHRGEAVSEGRHATYAHASGPRRDCPQQPLHPGTHGCSGRRP
jgi:hypothetical protein